jgi:hypothetical protein
MSNEQDTYSALTSPEKKGPCGCSGAEAASSQDELITELDAALRELGNDDGGDSLGLDEAGLGEDLLFSEIDQRPPVTLDDVIALAEQYPGLKITFSF